MGHRLGNDCLCLYTVATANKTYHTLLYVETEMGGLSRLALAKWASWSAGMVGRHVQCYRREWNGGRGLGPSARALVG